MQCELLLCELLLQCELLLWAQYTGWKFIVNTGVAYIRASNWASRYFRIMILTIRFPPYNVLSHALHFHFLTDLPQNRFKLTKNAEW